MLAVIAAGTSIRLLFAWAIGLGIDESYMVAAGRVMRAGYFDHPPLAWWLSTGAAQLFGSEAPLVVRLPFIVLFAVSSWLMYLLTLRIGSTRAGIWAVVALNLAPVFAVSSGGWVLPDGPLVCALLAFALCLIEALRTNAWRWWLGVGIAVGLGMLSKYTMALVVCGAAMAVLGHPIWRRRLLGAQPWVAVAVALLLFAPVIIWNMQTGWASFAFQGSRAAAVKFNPAGPLIVLAGSAAFLLPWVWLPSLVAGWRAARPRQGFAVLLVCLAAPPIVLFTATALWSRQVLFHWPAPGYLLLLPLLGSALAGWELRFGQWIRGGAWATAALLLLALGVVSVEVRTHVLGLARDPALQAVDWVGLRPALAQRGLLNGTIAAPNWADMGKIDYGLGPGLDVICLNIDARQYRFSEGAEARIGRDILIIGPRLDATRVRAAYAAVFEEIQELPPLLVDLPGRKGIEFPLFIGRKLRAWPPAQERS